MHDQKYIFHIFFTPLDLIFLKLLVYLHFDNLGHSPQLSMVINFTINLFSQDKAFFVYFPSLVFILHWLAAFTHWVILHLFRAWQGEVLTIFSAYICMFSS